MKGLVLMICVFSLTVLVHSDTPRANSFETFHRECQADPATRVDEDLLKKAHTGENLPGLGAHAFCLTKKFGVQKANGDIDKEELKKGLSSVITDKSKVDEAVEKCSQQKSTPEETAGSILKCFREYNPRPHGEHHHH